MRRFVLFGVASLALAIVLLALAREPWQVYAAYMTMSFGWLAMGLVTIPTLIGQWFVRKRGLAISLALNGASFGGIVVAPLLVLLIGVAGFTTAMLIAAGVMFVILVPAVMLWVPQHAATPAPTAASEPAWTRRDALRSLPFWTVSGSFSLALLAQVAFIVHQIAFMEPLVGRAQAALSVSIMTVMAVTDRLTLGAVVDRLDPRLISSVSMFSQAVALFCHDAHHRPDAAARLLRGLWLLGRQHHHAALADHAARVSVPLRSAWCSGFRPRIGTFAGALGPGLIGLIRDATGGYVRGAPALHGAEAHRRGFRDDPQALTPS